MKSKKQLPDVTMIAVCGSRHGETIAALYKSLEEIEPARTLLLTNIDITCTGIEVINVGGLDSWQKYNEFCILELGKHFSTSHCLLVQWDGYVLDGEQWSDEFLAYDYIGAKWLDIGKPMNVGNGGFSLRSLKLQDALLQDDFIQIYSPEDNSIAKLYHNYLVENYGIEYAPEEVADKFSFELNEPLSKTFGFHGWHWPKFRETIIFKRSHALGDVLSLEPIMHYFHKKGCQIAIDTSPENEAFFIQHYFPVVPKKHLNPKLQVREINFDMAYEVSPHLNHVEAYFQWAGVKDYVLRNPQLSMAWPKDQANKLFKKYVVLHVDDRDEPHRNIYGINWEFVVMFLNHKGYDVIQLGNGKHKDIKGAVQMRTPTAPMLMWVTGWADMFLGIDSGIGHVASGFDVPSIIFSGSVDMSKIYTDLTNKICINNHEGAGVCETKYCWHDTVGQSGKKCYIDQQDPPCSRFKTEQVIDAINKTIT